jgi:MarR family transcriptional regulator, transcriptional regulator for hemolysin
MELDRNRSAGYLTNWAARLFYREMERALAAHAMAPAYVPVFFALGGGAAMTQKELARRAAVEQPTMAATLMRMERDGLIARTPDPNDRRSALISLTEAASEKADAVRAAVKEINEVAFRDFSKKERRLYLSLLARVVQALEGGTGS